MRKWFAYNIGSLKTRDLESVSKKSFFWRIRESREFERGREAPEGRKRERGRE